MPYVQGWQRKELDMGRDPVDVGELTYVLYRAARVYQLDRPDDYQHRAEVMAALENAKQEFYRREVVPYEDWKITQNGDIFDEYDFEATGGTGGEESGGANDPAGQVEGAGAIGARQVRTSGNGGTE